MSAADSGAVSAPGGNYDPDLAELVERWASLAEPVRLAILALVRTMI